jgi:putative glutamine amidotransferase
LAPRLGVTGAARRLSPAWWCTRAALALCGARALRITVDRAPPRERLQGLVVGGGNDISPEHYGGDIRQQVRLDPDRDRLEIEWIEHALERGLPMLGICRGAQLINVVLGGNLHQDIRDMRRLTHNRPGLLPTKRVRLEPDSRLAGVCRRDRLLVNSLHHQAVDRAGVALEVVGRDRDHIAQAFESTDGRPILGVQWHPEYLFYLPSQLAIFRWLVHTAAC